MVKNIKEKIGEYLFLGFILLGVITFIQLLLFAFAILNDYHNKIYLLAPILAIICLISSIPFIEKAKFKKKH